MYRPLLDRIKIPLALKILLVLAVLVGVVAFCFTVFFPWIVDFIPYPMGNAGYTGP